MILQHVKMRPLLLKGHERPLTQVKYNAEGDLIFTAALDKVVSVWFSSNGQRLGTYNGHNGSVWSIDVDKHSRLLVTGSADNTIKLWEVKTGRCVHTWTENTAVKRVEFNDDCTMLLAITEERMGFEGTIVIYKINDQVDAAQMSEPLITIPFPKSKKATVASWAYLDKYIIASHEDGTISQIDWKNQGKILQNVMVHEKGSLITDLQMSKDRTYFITSGKDKAAHVLDVDTLQTLKTFTTDTPLNTAALTPVKDFAILGGGQEARDVTTTSQREGKFEARFYHIIFTEEIGRVKGHFGPLNTISVQPDGRGYTSGGEDGYVRVHHFDKDYLSFQYAEERT